MKGRFVVNCERLALTWLKPACLTFGRAVFFPSPEIPMQARKGPIFPRFSGHLALADF
jgi:hypothetical protein